MFCFFFFFLFVFYCFCFFFFFQAEDGIRDRNVTGVQTCALPIWSSGCLGEARRRPCDASSPGARRCCLARRPCSLSCSEPRPPGRVLFPGRCCLSRPCTCLFPPCSPSCRGPDPPGGPPARTSPSFCCFGCRSNLVRAKG